MYFSNAISWLKSNNTKLPFLHKAFNNNFFLYLIKYLQTDVKQFLWKSSFFQISFSVVKATTKGTDWTSSDKLSTFVLVYNQHIIYSIEQNTYCDYLDQEGPM